MAKARKQTRTQAAAELARAAQQFAGNEVELGDPEAEDAESDVIAELRGIGAGDGLRYRVSKVSGKPGEAAGYCATYDAGDLSLDAIREQFGGGKYRIRVVDMAGQYKGNATVDIVGLPKIAAPSAPAAPPPQDYNGIASIIEALKKGQPAPDGNNATMTLMLGMIENQGKMFQAMMTANKGPSVAEILAIVNAQGGGGNSKSSVDLLLEGVKLARELGGGGGGEDSMTSVAKEGLGILGQLIEQRGAPAAQHSAPRLPPPAAGAVAAAPVAVIQPEGGNVGILEKINWLKRQTAGLVLQASRDKDPELYAEVMLDNLPPFISPQEILQRLSAADAVDQLAALNSDVLQHREWFDDFRQEVVRMLTEAAQPEVREAPLPGVYPVAHEGLGDGGDES